MIYIVHGDDIVKSRFQIINQQKKLDAKNKVELDINEITPAELHQVVYSNDLFGNTPFIVLNITRARRLNLKPFAEIVLNTPEKTNLIVLAEKELPKSNAFIKLSKNKNIKVLVNKSTPKGNVFKFMDSVFYKQREVAYQEYGKLLAEDMSPFEIFSKILFGLNAVLNVTFDSPSVGKLHPFVKSKALRQAKSFSKESLIKLLDELYSLDKQVKTGGIDIENLIPLVIEKVLDS